MLVVMPVGGGQSARVLKGAVDSPPIRTYAVEPRTERSDIRLEHE